MKTLANFFLPAILLLSLMSCSKYYINTVSSSNMSKDKQTGEFQLDNDSVRISYGFTGQDGALYIKVYNKLAVPLFLDWTRSSIIYKGKAISYVPDKVNLSGGISTTTYNDRILPTSESTLNGTIQVPKEVTFIPPNSSVQTTAKLLYPDVFKNLSDSLYQGHESLLTSDGQVEAKVGNFEYSNSPLSFRSYLTLYTQDGNKNNTFSFDKEFFVSKSVKTFAKPQHLLDYSSPTADVFYYSNATGYGKTMTGVSIAALIVGAAALQTNQNQK
jgi:hypothetical protein